MDNTDKRNRLGEAPFQYRINKDQSVFIEYEGKQVKILKGEMNGRRGKCRALIQQRPRLHWHPS
ncbi:hypothetical protein [Rossellomorea aquimaris]|uniref:Uncharacterized protein n=1 Tax=Rossellomorea aquimaris TaxID=189382 RepID=A0A366ELW6_9BACI|nr:hypothetical protein [Rossellomorea aquimaris]RBP02976.1 hypothetical protein DET59_11173 [Rossellomorea aquimaris]